MMLKTTGDFGECITSFLLGKKFERQGLTVISAGSENLPYDLIIPFSIDETPFTKPAAISVKTRGEWSDVIPPNKKKLIEAQEVLQQKGYDFWISFVKYTFKNDNLQFGIYLVPTRKLDMDDDFKKVSRGKGPIEQIKTENLKEKAEIKFFSCWD